MSIQPVPEALAGEKMICADFFNLENGATVFMVTGSLSGQQIHVLLDTGAGLSFRQKTLIVQVNCLTVRVADCWSRRCSNWLGNRESNILHTTPTRNASFGNSHLFHSLTCGPVRVSILY